MVTTSDAGGFALPKGGRRHFHKITSRGKVPPCQRRSSTDVIRRPSHAVKSQQSRPDPTKIGHGKHLGTSGLVMVCRCGQ